MLSSIKRSSSLFSSSKRSFSDSADTPSRRSSSSSRPSSAYEPSRRAMTSGALSASTSISSTSSSAYHTGRDIASLRSVVGSSQILEIYHSNPNGWYLRVEARVAGTDGQLRTITLSIPVRKTKGRYGNTLVWDLTPYLDDAYPEWQESASSRRRIVKEHNVTGVIFQEYINRKAAPSPSQAKNKNSRLEQQAPRQVVSFVLNKQERRRASPVERWFRRMSSQ